MSPLPEPCTVGPGPTIGVLGGSFNPIHLGHVLLAITTKETKPVDKVVVVPVFRHPVKTDLLPFEDRVAMCEIAVGGSGVEVSTIEQETGESNVVMLRALRAKHPPGTKLLWICGDDVFDWIENDKGQAMMQELSGLVVQRRLHRVGQADGDRYYKEPVNDAHIRGISYRHGVEVDFIYGELPHFSSTLVRKSPASWRAFLPSRVAAYLDARPHLLAQLAAGGAVCGGVAVPSPVQESGDEPVAKRRKAEPSEAVTETVMRLLAVVHALQKERGSMALALSQATDDAVVFMYKSRQATDALLKDLPRLPKEAGEAADMVEELAYAPTWLARDRAVQDQHIRLEKAGVAEGAQGWFARAALARKYDGRMEVLINACIRSMRVQLDSASFGAEAEQEEALCSLFLKWAQVKEALGRERAFVCAGGSYAPALVRSSLRIRRRLTEVIEDKEKLLRRAVELQNSVVGHEGVASTGEALYKMLEDVSALEWALMGSFARTTPLEVVHKMLAAGGPARRYLTSKGKGTTEDFFDVRLWFETTTSAIDLLLTLNQALAAALCATAARGRPAL